MEVNYSDLIKPGPNKFIQASAGTGKTYILSKYYCSILNEWVKEGAAPAKGPANILVITFTRKAAAEMKERIYDDLISLSKNRIPGGFEEHVPDFAAGLRSDDPVHASARQALLQDFPANRIMTIDSFCGQILRQYAYRLDIDPLFRTDDEVLESRLREDGWKEVLKKANQKNSPELSRLLEFMSPKMLKEYCELIIDKDDELVSWKDRVQSLSPEELTAEFIARNTPRPRNWEALLNFFRDKKGELTAMEDSEEFSGWKANFLAVPDMASAGGEQGEIYLFILRNLIYLLLDGKGEFRSGPRSRFPRIEAKETKQFLRECAQSFEELIPLEHTQDYPDKTDETMVALWPDLLYFAEEFRRRLERAREAGNFLGFNDVIRLTGQLLEENEDIRLELHEKYAYIMVDEFQDTNGRRWEIIRRIADPHNRHEYRRLFIVGDVKQSIYSFQNADVKVMNKVGTLLREKAGDHFERYDLDKNFRSSRLYMEEVINPFFEKIMPDKGAGELQPWESVYRTGVTSDNAESGYGTEALKIYAELDDEEDPTGAGLCAAAVIDAQRWWKSFCLSYPGEAAKHRGPVIGVLLTRFTSLVFYQQAFRKAGINYSVAGGKGFWEQQEVLDVYHLISFLLNQEDDGALLGLLRSPILISSDTQIQELAASGPDRESLFSKLQSFPGLRIQAEKAARWLAGAGKLPHWELLDSILEEQGIELGYLAEMNGMQALENLEKLRLVLHRQAVSGSTLEDLRSFMLERMESGSKEAQAELEDAGDVVIMTVHGSKGLEFPVVILPDTQKRFKTGGNPGLISQKDGSADLHLTLEPRKGQKEKGRLFAGIAAGEKEEAKAERKRLLYVAVTRAKYTCSLILKFNTGKSRAGYGNWVDDLLANGDDSILGFSKKAVAEDLKKAESERTEWKWHIKSGAADAGISSPATPGEAGCMWRPAFSSSPFTRVITPHDIMEDHKNRIGFERSVAPDNGVDARSYGVFFHALMEYEWYDHERFGAEIDRWLNDNLPGVSAAAMKRRSVGETALYLESPLFASLRDAECFHELELTAAAGREDETVIISGVADLLCRKGDRWSVVDFKTDADMSAAELYKIQIRTYQWMLNYAYGIRAEGIIYFSREGVEVHIEYEDGLLQKLLGEDYSPVCPGPEDAGLLRFVHEQRGKKLLILHPTREAALIAALNLCRDPESNHPSIRHDTPGRMIPAGRGMKKRISSLSAKLLVRSVLEKDGRRPRRGEVRLLSEAFRLADGDADAVVRDEFLGLFGSYRDEKRAYNLWEDIELARSLDLSGFRGHTILISGYWSATAKEKELTAALGQVSDELYFRSGPGNTASCIPVPASSELSLPVAGGLDSGGPREYLLFSSARAELEYIAEKIAEGGLEALQGSCIVTADLNGYLPLIRRVFTRCGISWYSSMTPSLAEHPVVQIYGSLVRVLSAGPDCSWNDLHVLLRSMDGSVPEYAQLDLFIRSRKFTAWREVLPAVRGDDPGKKHIAEFERISQFLAASELLKPAAESFALAEKVRSVMRKYFGAILETSDRETRRIVDKIQSILTFIPEQMAQIGSFRDVALFADYFNDEIHEEMQAGSRIRSGVEVLSLLNAVSRDLSRHNVFLIGAVDGVLPVQPSQNPYLARDLRDYAAVNLSMLQRLTENSGSLTVSFPKTDCKESPADLSPFLRDWNPHESAAPPLSERSGINRLDVYRRLEGHTIRGRDEDPLAQRHNDFVRDRTDGPFSGHTGLTLDELPVFSASSLDDLLACRQRFWYKYVLHIRTADSRYGDRESADLGTFLHEVMKDFGNAGGYDAANRDEVHRILTACIRNFEERNGLNSDSDILFRHSWLPYTELEEGLLYKLADRIRGDLTEFGNAEPEKKFGEDQPLYMDSGRQDIRLRGQIDLILKHQDENTYYVADIKTGNITMPEAPGKNYSSQLLVYYLALKALKGEDVRVGAAYEQIRSFNSKESRRSPVIGDIGTPFPEDNKKDISLNDPEDVMFIGNHVDSWISEIEAIRTGAYSLTDKPEEKVCRYCDYRRICRKDSVPRVRAEDEDTDDEQ